MKLMSPKYFFSGIIIGIILLFSFAFSLPDGKLHVVFCDVGQGDSAYIRAPNNQDMLIDGGPNDKVLTCLGNHMPFYDRRIDVVMLTHPQKDHMQGLLSVASRYDIGAFVIGVEGNDTDGYKKLIQILRSRHIPVKNLYTGDLFRFGEVEFDIDWPERKWVSSHIGPHLNDLSYLSDLSDLNSSQVLGLSTSTNVNDFSYFVHLKYGRFDALFTGDGDSKIQPEVMRNVVLPDVSVLKYPHHGSKTGILPGFLDALKPELAIISVGKNSYGHPTQEALKLLSDRHIAVKRTDQSGDIEIISDGRGWNILNPKSKGSNQLQSSKFKKSNNWDFGF